MKKIIIGLIVFLLILFPFVMNIIQNKRLERELNLVNEYLDGNIKYEDAIDYVNKDVSNNKEEIEIDKCISDILFDLNDIRVNDISFNKEELVDYLKLIEDKKNVIINLKEKDYSCNKVNIDKDKINNYYDLISNDLNDKYEMIKLLNDNKDYWNLDNNEIVFNKRNLYIDFNEKYSYKNKIIDDKIGPLIEANDITIYKGDTLDINSKIKCIDSVDDLVKCEIDGKYDTNKIGSYNIKIIAKDTVGNVSNKSIKINVREKSKKPYYVHVIRNQNVVVVYGLDDKNQYTRIVKVFVCSVGRNNWTPTGTYTTSDKASWGKMAGGVYAQYYTRITGPYLFHSVPYFTKNKGNLEWEEYNKLGSAASLGCIRLAVRDAKWLYDNLPKGTTVKIYDGKLPSGVTKPSAIKISADDPNKGWDPTDPDKNNPWNK